MALKSNAPRIEVSFTIHSNRFQTVLVRQRITENVRGLLSGPYVSGGGDSKSEMVRMNVALHLDGSVTSAVDKNIISTWLQGVEKSSIDDVEITRIYPDGQRQTTYE